MISKNNFIRATEEYNTFENHVPAYYFRKGFTSHGSHPAKITIAVCGFYELYFNGERITRGLLSPYISNTDDYVYADEYEVTLKDGDNSIGVILGNGFQNNPGGEVWDFDKASFRSSPSFSLTVEAAGEEILISDESFKIKESPIRSDDYRFGEHYDANYEIEGWSSPAFDDSMWENALKAPAPKGEIRITDVPPITKEYEIEPLEIIPCKDGFIYDFGVCTAGLCRLRVRNGKKGQKIGLRYADSLRDGDLDLVQIWFTYDYCRKDWDIVHLDTYVCRGDEVEEYTPSFTYHGFRYVKVTGITTEQATKDLLTYQVYHTEFETVGGFASSSETLNTLQEITLRSTLANFYHIPTDCPHREKNGWTADAALAAETTFLNFNPQRSYREWMRNVCRAQGEDGALPGIVPHTGWGFTWGNGLGWDCVVAWLPYFSYKYLGDTEMIKESAPSMLKYLRHLREIADDNGFIHICLGDWCHVGREQPKAPLHVVDTILSMDIAAKIALMLDAVGMKEDAEYARGEEKIYRNTVREKLVDFSTMTVRGNCQTCQAMAIYYGVFEENEEQAAFEKLLELIHEANDSMDLGVIGGKVIFRLLSKFGYHDLALHMIAKDDYPSYGNWLKRGATSLWENFFPDTVSSMNHQFWGDISAYFITSIAGIDVNPDMTSPDKVNIAPSFAESLDFAEAYYNAPKGKIFLRWERNGGGITLTLEIPEGVSATAILPKGYVFESGAGEISPITSGIYKIKKI